MPNITRVHHRMLEAEPTQHALIAHICTDNTEAEASITKASTLQCTTQWARVSDNSAIPLSHQPHTQKYKTQSLPLEYSQLTGRLPSRQ